MKITERILQYLEIKNISKYKFHNDLGFSNGFLDKSREIGTEKYAKILEYFPELNPEWLLTGNGEMLKDNNQPISLVQEQKPIYVTRKQTGNDDIVDKLLNRLEQQSEEIGKLKTELEIYKRGDIPGAMDVGVAVAN